jgi:hypothetical protein
MYQVYVYDHQSQRRLWYNQKHVHNMSCVPYPSNPSEVDKELLDWQKKIFTMLHSYISWNM